MKIFGLSARDASFILMKWILANVLGFLLGSGLGYALSSVLCPGLFGGDSDFIILVVICYAFWIPAFSLLVVSMLQSIILRQYLQELPIIRWIMTTIMGGFMGIVMIVVTVPFLGKSFISNFGSVAWIIVGVIFGATIGFFQWLLLKSRLSKSVYWILGNAVSWLIPSPILPIWSHKFQLFENSTSAFTILGSILILSVMVSFISGLFLIWLFGQNLEILSLSDNGQQDINTGET